MLRACLTIVAVAALSACLAHLRDAQGGGPDGRDAEEIAWIRTVDGWEPSSVLSLGPPPQGPPTLHPSLVASLQLGVSLFALLALPSTNLSRRKS